MIGLLTDYAATEADVAAIKGRFADIAPGLLVLDMMHSVAAQSVLAGQRLLRITVPQFPKGSLLLVVVDYHGRLMVLRAQGYTFAGPDNGLFTPWLPGELAIALESGGGLDALVAAAAQAATGTPLEQLGPSLLDPVRVPRPEPTRQADGSIQGVILYADQFGNLITNISDVRGGAARIRQHTVPVRVTYASAGPGQLLALISSEGELEIALRDGSAAAALHAEPGELVFWSPSR